jgi:hypothetical protein
MALNLKSAGGGGIILNPNTTPTDVTLNLPATSGTLATTETLAASSGASVVGYLPSGTSAVPRTTQDKLRESVSVKDFGAVGDGVADDTAALQLALNAGGAAKMPVDLLGLRFKVSSRLNVSSYSGFVGNGSAVIFATAAGFNNASNTNHYQSNSTVIDVSGLLVSPFTPSKSCQLNGFVIEFEAGDGRSVDGITCRNADSPHIVGVEIKNGVVGAGIRASSLVGNPIIAYNYIHDFYTNSAWATHPQTTGIEIDGDRVNGIVSSGVQVIGNRIVSLSQGATTTALYGYQTDGVNLQEGSRYLVYGNQIVGCDEAIDFFCSDSDILGNTIENSRALGIKIIHGAQRNKVRGNSIINAGWSGILLAASDNRGQSVDSNIVESNSVVGIDYLSYWGALGYATACISTWTSISPAVTYQPTNNIIRNNFCNPKSTGKYGLYRGSQGSNNVFEGNIVVAGASIADTGTLGLETGITGFVGVPTSETGTGSLVRASSPALSSPSITGQQNNTNTSSGAASIGLSLINSSASANTETILDFSPSNTGSGVRSAQISAVNNGSNQIAFKFSLSNAGSPAGVGYINANGSWFFGAGSSPVSNPRIQSGSVQFSKNPIFEKFSADANGSETAYTKSRSSTQGTQLVVVNDDVLGGSYYYGSDGTAYQHGALIRARVTGTPSGTSMPSRLELGTSAVGSVSPTIRMTINQDGDIFTPSGSTNMAAGFFRIPAAGGVPSGVPASVSGTVPMYFDTTNNHFYIYNGAWKKVLLA